MTAEFLNALPVLFWIVKERRLWYGFKAVGDNRNW
jgi:hypothetical protein